MGVSAIAKTNVHAQTPGFKKGVRIKIHRLAEKDTLYSLEKQYGLPVGSLAEFNNIKKEKVTKLPTGMAIRIPLSGVSTKRNTPPKPVARTASQTAAPAKKVAKPASQTAAPAKKFARPASQTATPVKKFARPASQTSAPAKKFARPASQTATPVKKAARPVSQVVTQAKKPEHAQAAGTKAPAAKNNNPFAGGYTEYKDAIASRESSNRTDAVNRAGYLGRYQMGKVALEEAGFYKRAKDEKQSKKYTGKWTGTAGVTNTTSFLTMPAAQEIAMDNLQRAQWRQIKNKNLEQYSGTNITYVVGNTTNSLHVTDSGMLAGAHLAGSGNLEIFLRSGGKNVPKDGNDTLITEYMKKFGNYDISFITTNCNKSASSPAVKATTNGAEKVKRK